MLEIAWHCVLRGELMFVVHRERQGNLSMWKITHQLSCDDVFLYDRDTCIQCSSGQKPNPLV